MVEGVHLAVETCVASNIHKLCCGLHDFALPQLREESYKGVAAVSVLCALVTFCCPSGLL